MKEFKLFVVLCIGILATEQALELLPSQERVSMQPMSPILASLTGEGTSIGIAVPDERAAKLIGGTGGEAECGDWDVEWWGCQGSFVCPSDFNVYWETYWVFAEHPYSKANSTRECDGGSGEDDCDLVTDTIIGCAT